jgi:hypothetical protein
MLSFYSGDDRMTALRADGTSYNEIANALNADAVPTKQGGIWRFSGSGVPKSIRP